MCTYDSTIIKFPQESTPFRDLSFWTRNNTVDFLPIEISYTFYQLSLFFAKDAVFLGHAADC